MMQKHKPYELIRVHNDSIYMEAAYCKYYPNAPYIAVFEEYPAERTRIVVFRKVSVSPSDSPTNRNICKLISHKPDGTSQLVGYYKPVRTVYSEKQATESMLKHIQSYVFLHRTFGSDPS